MNTHLVYCTLFNKGYLSRGIAMYESLEAQCNDFTLYVFAFDKETEAILLAAHYSNMIVIPYEQFEDETLRRAKQNRTKGEFFWTCGCHTIKYVLENYKVDHCTYIDADMYFYSNPLPLYEGMMESKASVGIIAHNYPDYPEYRHIEKKNGKYCVQYNTFLNNEQGKKVLKWWCDSCIECCTGKPDGEHFGDQKYIELFSEKFGDIYEYQNPGAGIAPWNVCKFYLDEETNVIRERKNNNEVKLYFYHFHGLNIVDNHMAEMKVLIRPGKHDKKLLNNLYCSYLEKIRAIEEKINIDDEKLSNERISLIKKMHLLLGFCISEPNVLFLFRKVYRYLRYELNDRVFY